ncbi:UPF0158 family protein, partial [Pseudomonas aeruginosa]|uniref:UPF0158 family protein n=1 Tax=Pseudomonas aeruginosa TaxID=287 RepID=UPI003981A4A9
PLQPTTHSTPHPHTMAPPHLIHSPLKADELQSRKPFKAFKHSLMEYPELLQDWYRYQNERLREWALDWLEDNDIQPAARQSPTSLLPPPGKPFA